MEPLRTKKGADVYRKFISEGFLSHGCKLCKEKKSVKEFKYWRIMKVKFPWDNIAKIHDMILPKRHITYGELTKKEKEEYDKIKIYIEKKYELIAEAATRKKSIPGHFHIHLIVLKRPK